MITVAYWNTNHLQDLQVIIKLVAETKCHILMLSEMVIDDEKFVAELNSYNPNNIFYPDEGLNQKAKNEYGIRVYTRFRPNNDCLIADHHNMTIRRYKDLPFLGEITFAFIHFYSKLHLDGDEQNELMIRSVADVRNAETKVGHQRTLVVGDFNMNPFEMGMVSSEKFHAISCQKVVGNDSRVVKGLECDYFYNPSWSFFGDLHRPPGTFYYNSSGRPRNYYWNVFDQVIIRPELLQYFKSDELRIVTSIGGESLLNNHGHPDSGKYSDHLPIVFTLRGTV